MKHIVITLLLILIIVNNASARIVVAPEAGISYAGGTATGIKLTNMGYIAAPKFGIHIESKLSNTYYVQPGLFYSVYGVTGDYLVAGITEQMSKMTLTNKCIEAPLYLLMKTGIPCKPRLVLGAGVIGLLMRSTGIVTKIGSENYGSDKWEGPFKLKVAGGLTIGCEFPMGFYAKVTYQTLFQAMTIRNYPEDIEVKLHQISITAGYLIGKVMRN